MDGHRPDKLQVLFLAASHREGDELALGREVREIEARIRASRYRDDIALTTKLAVRPGDLLQALREHEPHIVHFSGHGTRAGHILLLDDDGDPMPVGKDALVRLFAAMRGRTRLVVFNACFSRPQAEAITEHVDCAIGTSAALSDVGARVFASELYAAITHGASVGKAFDEATAALPVHGLVENDPALLLRQNQHGPVVDPYTLFLLAPEAEVSTSTPSLEPAATAKLWMHAGRVLARYRLAIAVLVLLSVLAGIAWALWWPRLLVPRFDGGGIAVAVRRGAPDPAREAHAYLVRALQALGEQRVQPVVLPILGADDQALVAAARDAGASLVVTIEDQGGPRLRVLPIAGKNGTHIIDHIPPLSIARAETRDALVPVLFTLSWLATRAPDSLPRRLALPIPDEAIVGRAITVLTMYLRELTDAHQQWVHEARDPLSRMVTDCTGALDDWDCALATYLYYSLVCPDCPQAPAQLAAVAERGPGVIADATTLELMDLRCATDPDWIGDELTRLRDIWAEGDCMRLGLAVPASCLAITHQRRDAWIDALAAPAFDDYTHCGPMAARVLAQRAYMYVFAGELEKAAEDYLHAAARAPGDPVYMLDWAAVALQQEPLPLDARAQIDARLEPYAEPDMPYQTRIWASFLRWYAAGSNARARQLCASYEALPPGEAAMPALGPLGEKICTEARACRVYRILIEANHEGTDTALCNVLAVGNIDE